MNKIAQDNQDNEDNVCRTISVRDFLKYIENEVVVLQSEQRAEMQKSPEEQSVNNSGNTDVFASLMVENFVFNAIFDALFGGTMIAEMFGMLVGDDFEMFLGGLFLLLDNDAQSQRLQAPFILSVYPKGRRTVKNIMKNMNLGHMRGSASRKFMTPHERQHQLAILGDAEKKLKRMNKYCVSHIYLDSRYTVQHSINSSFYNMGKRRAFA